MKIVQAILSGSIVWMFVLTAFSIMSFIPGIKNSEMQQGLIIGILLIPFASIGAAHYYRKGDTTNGFKVGLVMVSSALFLDVIVTVPMVEIPYNGGSYFAFFTNPLLWFLVVENLVVVYLYWRLKVKRSVK